MLKQNSTRALVRLGTMVGKSTDSNPDLAYKTWMSLGVISLRLCFFTNKDKQNLRNQRILVGMEKSV
jgi:hypothetical protein